LVQRRTGDCRPTTDDSPDGTDTLIRDHQLTAEPAEHAENSCEPETSASSASSAAVLIQRRRSTSDPLDEALSRRVIVERVRPTVDGGRFAVKRTIGESIAVAASIFADGHDVISAVVMDRHLLTTESTEITEALQTKSLTTEVGEALRTEPQDTISVSSVDSVVNPGGWRNTPMTIVGPGTDEWIGQFAPHDIGSHEFVIVAWVDRFRTWRRDLEIKVTAGQDVSTELLEGALLVREAAARAEQLPFDQARVHADCLLARAEVLSDAAETDARVAVGLNRDLATLMDLYPDRSRATMSAPVNVWVDRERARFSAWYEMFPRSAGPDRRRSGTFAEAAAMLPRIADLGFDVLYLPPIHPIGRRHRKGRNNAPVAAAGDPGSPWAIGSEDGGHTAVDPALGTLDDFIMFRLEAERLGLEVALDLAWQCSPDHPWVREHPEWFRHRRDGTIKYAENPPKKYQDIYPFDFECREWRALWRALLDVTLVWVDRGVRIFRVDNPHTKTFNFWEWMIAEVHARRPDVLFLAEAFTRPAVMRYLAKAGFSQSYTYFTWRNSKSELTEYLTELTATEVRDYLRPNLFANTPDILHAYLQEGGRPAFQARLLLAATLGASYGIYSGFELCERDAVPGTEEYLDSEKYQFRPRRWDQGHSLDELIARVNQVRREHRPLHHNSTLQFHATDNPQLIAYSKTAPDDPNDALLMIVNLDPHHMQHGWVEVPVDADSFAVCDLLDDTVYAWHRGWNYVRLDPGVRQGHILKVERR
jgi:starch synthase (maltosyl-transferring)